MKSGKQHLLETFLSLSECFLLKKLNFSEISDEQARGKGEKKNATVFLKLPVKLKRQSNRIIKPKPINIHLLSITQVSS